MTTIPADYGTWIDGHWGQYATARLIEIAASYGWRDNDSLEDGLDAIKLAKRHLANSGPSYAEDITADQHEYLIEAADEAEEFMNTLAPADHFFTWNDGEFILARNDEMDEDGEWIPES